MDIVGCAIRCRCGGVVDRLMEDEAYYLVTENFTIIFRGYCNICDEAVSVERDIQSLLLLCPTENKRAN